MKIAVPLHELKAFIFNLDFCNSLKEIVSTIPRMKRFLGMRVANVYDVDNKTYLIKLAKPDEKAVILLESGIRFHSTDFEWPKNISPSGFSMKLRKHLRTRRLEKISQLGVDRIVDFQFGSNEAAYHVILELYDRGNIVLTDYEYTILNILRVRTDESQDVKFVVRETYPVSAARQADSSVSYDSMLEKLTTAKEGDNLKKILNSHLIYGPALIEHCLRQSGIPNNARLGKEFIIQTDMDRLMSGLKEGEDIFQRMYSKPQNGYVIQKREKRPQIKAEEEEELLTYDEFHPFLYKQNEASQHLQFGSFNKAVDEFFSKLEGQKLDLKTLQMEKAALKKLENVRKDHEKRLETLQKEQDTDKHKAHLIEMNLELVDSAIVIVRSAIANQIDWTDIYNLVKEAQATGDPVASSIKALKLDTNHFTMLLSSNIYLDSDEEDEEYNVKPMKVDIDLALSAYSNARKYYDKKRQAFSKEVKTVDASEKALKVVEKKTKQTLKEVATVATINKARKTYWFEKFIWFVSSENYLVIGGRDQQQNELIVKRYLTAGDVYVHADLHGASSVVIKNHSGGDIPPKTLNEAGTMAVCNSAAWDAKVVTSAWWVRHDQVSKTAPSGEYLSTGSFMIRGKKNYLPPCYLVYGFGIMFKVDETSVFIHKDERKVRTIEEVSETGSDDMSNLTTEDAISSQIEGADSTDSDSASEDHDLPADARSDKSIKSTSESDISHCTKPEPHDTEVLKREECNDKTGLEPEENSADLKQYSTTKSGGSEDVSNPGQEGNDCVDVRVQPPASEADADAANSSEEEALFPDTNIQLQHLKGDQLKLQRTISTSSTASHVSNEATDADITKEFHQARLSAKQRREIKRRKHMNSDSLDVSVKEEMQEVPKPSDSPSIDTSISTEERSVQQPLKRGQKSKLKKIKDKYKDQDNEERELKMQILASSGPQKEKPMKGKKGKQQKQQQQVQRSAGSAGKNKSANQKGWIAKKTLDDITVQVGSMDFDDKNKDNPAKTSKADDGNESDEEKKAILEDENIQISEDVSIVDSLTGIPSAEDGVLFSVPVCAPYGVLTNYKYKVKLTPGNTKRGKAAKTALQIFLQDKLATQREKEVLKAIKDTDLSRNFPGKVKVSAPNLQQIKNKKK